MARGEGSAERTSFHISDSQPHHSMAASGAIRTAMSSIQNTAASRAGGCGGTQAEAEKISWVSQLAWPKNRDGDF